MTTTTVVLNGRFDGHLPGEVLELPEPIARALIADRVGRAIGTRKLPDGSFEAVLPDGTVKAYKTASGARRAFEASLLEEE